MKKVSYIALLSLFVAPAALGATVSRIDVSGNQRMDAESIRILSDVTQERGSACCWLGGHLLRSESLKWHQQGALGAATSGQHSRVQNEAEAGLGKAC